MTTDEGMAKEVVDRLFSLTMRDPDEAIRVIDEFIRETPGIEEVPATRTMRSFAVGTKACACYREANGTFDEKIKLLCEMALSDLRYAQHKDPSFRAEPFDKVVDSIAEMMEPKFPGEVQKLIGWTKIKWLGRAERVTVNPHFKSLTASDLAILGNIPIGSLVPIQSIYLGTMLNKGDYIELTGLLFSNVEGLKSQKAPVDAIEFRKDQRTTWLGKPKDAGTYGKWQLHKTS